MRQIRVAIGEPGDQLSPVWKIWNQNDDVYLSGKITGGIVKISMHASGVWAVAAPSGSGAELSPGNRRMKAWRRPAEFHPGWTWGPHVGVPRMADTDHAKIDEGQTTAIEWLPRPKPGMRATITVIFATPEKTPQDLDEISANDDVYLSVFLALQNKQKVFVRIRYEPLTIGDNDLIGHLQPYADDWIAVNDEGLSGFLITFMHGSDEVPWVYVLKWAVPSA